MPSDQTPPHSQLVPHVGPEQVEAQTDFSQACAGESGDPIWETDAPQMEATGNAARAERARRALRETDGKVPAGRLIDLIQGQSPPQRPPARQVGA